MRIEVGKVYGDFYLNQIMIVAKIEGRYYGGNGEIYQRDGKLVSARDIPNHYAHLIERY